MITTDAIDALLDDESAAMLIRALMIDIDTPFSDLDDMLADMHDAPYTDDALNDLRNTIIDLQRESRDPRTARETLTDLALRLSLCPLHMIDYAICFDDDDAECAAIRTIHPSHDT
jgi:hypothetical protein